MANQKPDSGFFSILLKRHCHSPLVLNHHIAFHTRWISKLVFPIPFPFKSPFPYYITSPWSKLFLFTARTRTTITNLLETAAIVLALVGCLDGIRIYFEANWTFRILDTASKLQQKLSSRRKTTWPRAWDNVAFITPGTIRRDKQGACFSWTDV